MIDVFSLPRGAQEFWIAYAFEGLDQAAVEQATKEVAAKLGCSMEDVARYAGRELLRRTREIQEALRQRAGLT